MEKSLKDKTIAMVVAFRGFRDVEYFIPRNILSEAGARITTISSEGGMAVGEDGGEAKIDLEAKNFRVNDFDAIVFIGGPGMGRKLDDEDFQKIAKDAMGADKVLGAICIAPALLAKAGVLSGKKATVWSGPLEKVPIRMLFEGGAEYQDEDVVIDGKIVTANGPGAAQQFAEAIIGVLTPTPNEDFS